MCIEFSDKSLRSSCAIPEYFFKHRDTNKYTIDRYTIVFSRYIKSGLTKDYIKVFPYYYSPYSNRKSPKVLCWNK